MLLSWHRRPKHHAAASNARMLILRHATHHSRHSAHLLPCCSALRRLVGVHLPEDHQIEDEHRANLRDDEEDEKGAAAVGAERALRGR